MDEQMDTCNAQEDLLVADLNDTENTLNSKMDETEDNIQGSESTSTTVKDSQGWAKIRNEKSKAFPLLIPAMNDKHATDNAEEINEGEKLEQMSEPADPKVSPEKNFLDQTVSTEGETTTITKPDASADEPPLESESCNTASNEEELQRNYYKQVEDLQQRFHQQQIQVVEHFNTLKAQAENNEAELR